jgi:hypothetical protein
MIKQKDRYRHERQLHDLISIMSVDMMLSFRCGQQLPFHALDIVKLSNDGRVKAYL